MSGSATAFRETRIYPVLFMIVLTAIFVAVLAFMFDYTREAVETNRRRQLQITVLRLFDIPGLNPATMADTDLNNAYGTYITEQTTNGLPYYECRVDSLLKGYCFRISGGGLWGSITAMISVSPDYKTILGLEVIDQSETPGLGGRIGEGWFLNQFKSKPLTTSEGSVFRFGLVPEGEKTSGDTVQQITGATISTKALLNIVHDEMTRILPMMGGTR